MAKKNSWKDYFSMSKKDRNAFVFTLVVITAIMAAPFLCNKYKKNDRNTDSDSALAKLSAKNVFFENEEGLSGITPEKLFLFDPNTLGLEGWLSLGLSRKTASTILNYTSKGGYFKQAEDIRKIWGLKKEEADKLIPFIRIDNKKNVKRNFANDYTKKSIPIVDINKANAADFKALPGIGNVLSERIVKYRNSLKGFAAVDDLKKVYGISDAAFDVIRPFLQISESKKTANILPENTDEEKVLPQNTIEKVNINTASEKEMTAAGIPRNMAKAIIIYREQNGNYNTVEDIKKIIFITPEMYEKAVPLMTTK